VTKLEEPATPTNPNVPPAGSQVAESTVADAYLLPAAEVVHRLGADGTVGLSVAEAASRLGRFGPNRLADPPTVPLWRKVVAQFTDLLILILLGAAVVSFVVSRELKTPIVIVAVVMLNAVVGLLQEAKAAKTLDALRKMVSTQARVRRSGEMHQIDSSDLVPGDIVMIEAGERVPADGRLFVAASLEIEEAALTGESAPSTKHTETLEKLNAPLGDRTNLVFMNTSVTRGRGEFVVTDTGMATEMGSIASLINATEQEETPLQKQLHDLGRTLAMIAGGVAAIVFVVGLIRGRSFSEVFETTVALAVASVPEGLPAVVALTLALGTAAMARQNAIVKRLPSVETLGCTSVICSDKTGTLTLNQMTAQQVATIDGTVAATAVADEKHQNAIAATLTGSALCSDAVIKSGNLIGDPTEGALVQLAYDGGIDVDDLRRVDPRVDEVPFDSAVKYMATAHRVTDEGGDCSVRIYVKGAPDVIGARTTMHLGRSGLVPKDEAWMTSANDEMANQGMRVLAIAQREMAEADYTAFIDGGGKLDDLIEQLTLVSLIGIIDPPRPEAKAAIAEAHAAGIDVKMITGDHVSTAAAIGKQLGLTGRAISGAQIDAWTEQELKDNIESISVVARVSPEHKLRIVGALQERSHVVAMTGDGVNDAPALRKADIGVAMGITGTEVTKEAATMVLVDDNLGTIVGAVKRGRAIYDNIVTFLRFQLATSIGFSITFLLSTVFAIAGGKPFTAIQILFVNLIIDGPPALALGVDPAAPDVMERKPRPRAEKILSIRRVGGVVVTAASMTAAAFLALWLAPDSAVVGEATVAGTMAFTTFVLCQLTNALVARAERRTVFSRATFTNRLLWLALGAVLLIQAAVVHLGFMQSIFDTVSLSAGQWALCGVLSLFPVVAGEAVRIVMSSRRADFPSVAVA
jgi:P-type Ca2+ transporter type 2C